MVKFSLNEAVNMFQQSIEDREDTYIYYYDKGLNQFSYIPLEYVLMVEDGEISENLLDWQKDIIDEVNEYFDKSERREVFELYSHYDINPYSFLECFAWYKNDDDLAYAIQGRGAFHRFKDIVTSKGWLDEWYQFEREQYAKEVIEWAEQHHLEYNNNLE